MLLDAFSDSGGRAVDQVSDLIGQRYEKTRQQILDLVLDPVPPEQ